MSEKLYTAQEVIDIISEGWETEEELKNLYKFVDNVKMKNEEELTKLCDSGYTSLVYHAYDPEDEEI